MFKKNKKYRNIIEDVFHLQEKGKKKKKKRKSII